MQFFEIGNKVYQKEILELQKLAQVFDENFNKACELILETQGRVIVSGVGKSGHIASKIAATMASTGTPAFFVHPNEACHGDLGMIANEDVIIAISHSGQSSELLTILPILKNRGVKIITITSKNSSSMAKIADVHLCTYVEEEAGPLNLAPTSSTTATLVLGDTLAIAVSKMKNFSTDDFAKSHPGGALGKKLLVHNKDIMVKGANIPLINKNDSITNAILEMNNKRLGFVAVIDDNQKLYGIFTDGDLRRALTSNIDLKNTPVAQVSKQECFTVKDDELVSKSLEQMKSKSINCLIVVNDNHEVIGGFNIHQIMDTGIF